MRYICSLLLILIVALTFSSLSFAIVRRHDVPDSAYIELAAKVPPVINLDLLGPEKAADGMGVLIAPRWILTAAHLEEWLKPGMTVRVGTESLAISDVFVYPDWEATWSDIALLRLDTSASTIAPVPIDRGYVQEGDVIVVAGYGDYGDGIRGPEGNDRTLRAACNRVDEIDRHFLKYRFDAPGHPDVLPMEGISGPGDSGNPAFVKRQSGWFTAGVGSSQSTRATGGKEGRYGVTEYYIWTAKYAAWIDETLGKFGDKPAESGWRAREEGFSQESDADAATCAHRN